MAAGAVGAVRTKKWKPFHNMHKLNKLRELRRKQLEDAHAQGPGDVASDKEIVQRPDEPLVATTPFQATRLMRAFDVFRDPGTAVHFLTRLNVDLTRESVRGTCHLPHGLATKMRVLAFCPDDQAAELLEAGADFAGISDPLRRINQGWLGFDRCLATPAIMPQVMKVAKVLGPRKLMPNPRSGTVVQNLKQAIREVKGGTFLEYRAEGAGEVRAVIADASFSDAKVLENMKFLVQTLLRARPRGAAGASGGSAGARAPGAALIPGQPVAAGEAAKDAYFLEASLQLGASGPQMRVDAETMLPASVGYFR